MLRVEPGKSPVSLALPPAPQHKFGGNITAVSVAIRMDVPILLPQHRQIDTGALELGCQRRPVWLGPMPKRLRCSATKQSLLQNLVAQIGIQGPRKPCRLRPLEIVLNGATRHSKPAPDLPRAQALVMQP